MATVLRRQKCFSRPLSCLVNRKLPRQRCPATEPQLTPEFQGTFPPPSKQQQGALVPRSKRRGRVVGHGVRPTAEPGFAGTLYTLSKRGCVGLETCCGLVCLSIKGSVVRSEQEQEFTVLLGPRGPGRVSHNFHSWIQYQPTLHSD